MWVQAGDGNVFVNLSHVAAVRCGGEEDCRGRFSPSVTLYLALPGIRRTVYVRAVGGLARDVISRLEILSFAREPGAPFAPDMYSAVDDGPGHGGYRQ